jgi:predicted ATP-grasp superfamily ATP-dependent carboligase
VLAVLAPLGLPPEVIAVAPDVLERCQHKEQLLEAARRLGVDTTPCEVASNAAEVRAAAARVGFPVVIKAHAAGALHAGASAQFIGGKARFAASAVELDLWLHTNPAFPPAGVLVQRQAQGPRHNVYFAAWRGELRGTAQTLTLRTDRPDGSGLAVEGIGVDPTPRLVVQTRALVKELGYTGVGCAQFLVDPRDGSTCFLEINARLGANCAVVTACGLDLPRLFVELMKGDVPLQAPATVGRRFAWFGGDLDGLLECRRQGLTGMREGLQWLGRCLRAQLRADDHVTFLWSDPWPALARLFRRVIGGVLRVRP